MIIYRYLYHWRRVLMILHNIKKRFSRLMIIWVLQLLASLQMLVSSANLWEMNASTTGMSTIATTQLRDLWTKLPRRVKSKLITPQRDLSVLDFWLLLLMKPELISLKQTLAQTITNTMLWLLVQETRVQRLI